MSMPGLNTLRPSNRGGYVLESNAIQLHIRQQPECALLTQENKEKGRKPIDPPPIVQMLVDRSCDPQEQWIVSPYLFMIAVIVEGEEGDTLLPSKYLVGQTSSSLHRLKDIDNKDGGFFVFGDISVRKAGKHRLKFNLFDTDKETGDVVLLKTIESDVFEVVSNKEFRGLTESTHLSRTFSDQGVRLRLRKEPRTLQGHSGGVKRSYGGSEQGSPDARNQAAGYGGPVSHDQTYNSYAGIKRQRSDADYSSSNIYSPYQDNSSSFYGTNTLSSNASAASGRWADQLAKSQGSVGYSMTSSRPTSSYSLASSSGQMSRAYPNLPQSAMTGAGYAGRAGYFDDTYSQSAQQYFSQTQADPYGALTGMHTSASLADSGSLVSSSRPGTQGYVPSNADFGIHPGAVNTPQSAAQTPYQQDLTGSAYSGGRPGSTSIEPSQTYAATSSTSGLPFDQSTQAGLSSSVYSQSNAPSVQNPYPNGMSRMQYPVQSSGISHTGVPADLFGSTLNSTWPGAFGEQDNTPGGAISTQALSGHQGSGYSTASGKQSWQ